MQGQDKELGSPHYEDLGIYRGHLNMNLPSGITVSPTPFTFWVLGMRLTRRQT